MAVQGKAGHLFTNWAKTYSCHPELFFEPQNVEELAQVLEMLFAVIVSSCEISILTPVSPTEAQ